MGSLQFYIFILLHMVLATSSEPSNVIQKEVTVKDFQGAMTKEILISLKDAEKLQIENSNVTEYPSHVFSLLPNIRNLVILRSHFVIMDLNIYAGADKLEEIYFAHNNVPELQLDLLRHTTFEKIVIHDQPQVKKIPTNFANETLRLKHFECSKCGIASVEEDAFSNLNKMETLDLKKNYIKKFPAKSLQPLKNLRKLNLADNSIEKFTTDDILGLENLEYLDLSKNPLKELNLLDVVRVAPNLKSVDISSTQIPEAQIDEHVKKTKLLFISDRVD